MKQLNLLSALNHNSPIASVVARQVSKVVYPIAQQLRITNMIRSHVDFGWVIANPAHQRNYAEVWNEPDELIWLAGGYGPKYIGHCANAACQIRLAARTGRDTLDIANRQTDLFESFCEDQSDSPLGNLVFADFRHGGAVFVTLHGIQLLVAVSSLEGDENSTFGFLIGSVAITTLARGNILDLITNNR